MNVKLCLLNQEMLCKYLHIPEKMPYTCNYVKRTHVTAAIGLISTKSFYLANMYTKWRNIPCTCKYLAFHLYFTNMLLNVSYPTYTPILKEKIHNLLLFLKTYVQRMYCKESFTLLWDEHSHQ